MKKYFYRAIDDNGIFFNHESDYAYRLVKMVDRESHGSDGAIYARWYFAKIETNITDELIYLVGCGYKI